MDQEDCSKHELQNKSLSRSSARHIRRKRLKDALKAEKERTLLPNGDNIIITKEEELLKNCIETYNESKDNLSKSKAKRLRKKNKKDVSNDICQVNKNLPTSLSHADLTGSIGNSQEKLICNIVQVESNQALEQETFDCLPTSGQKKKESSEIIVHRKIIATGPEKCKLPQCRMTESEFGQNIPDESNLNKKAPEKIAAQVLCESVLTESEKECSAPVETRILSNMVDAKESAPGKTKEEIKAEREARRAAKVAAKGKSKGLKNENGQESTISQGAMGNELNLAGTKTIESKTNDNSRPTESHGNSSVKEDIKAEREARRAAKTAAKAKVKEGKTVDGTESGTCQATAAAHATSGSAEAVVKVQVSVGNPTETTDKSCAKEEQMSDEKVEEGKSKAELRAERRAKQEAQRAAKQQKQQTHVTPQQKKEQKPLKPEITKPSPALKEITKKPATRKIVVPIKDAHEVNLFRHLYLERDLAIVEAPSLNSSRIHPAVVRLGVQYANKVIVGSNARCIALLAAVKQLLRDFERPSQADFIRGLEANLQESATYLHHCRPSAVSMQNALRHIKWQMTQLPSTLSDMEAKNKLDSAIDTYIEEQINLAGKGISITIQTKISNGDIILTYGYSSLINKILLDAHGAGKKFRVIVVDGRPWLEGREQLRRLTNHGIECSYILINALSYVMPEVSKVFLGAHAILANGAVMSRAGTAQVALMAKAFNVPVLVACETHKSCERVQTDSIVYNELGNADELANHISDGHTMKKSTLSNWKTRKSLNLLNITYDVTPADLVTAVVTELAILPCTSVPVILRIKPSEI